MVNLPNKITWIGKIRKDAQFNYQLTKTEERNKVFVEFALTSEEIRASKDIEYKIVKV